MKNMNSIELEAQKARLAREILCINDVAIINNLQLALRGSRPKKREIGFLKGKAKVFFHDDWSMTPEELGMA